MLLILYQHQLQQQTQRLEGDGNVRQVNQTVNRVDHVGRRDFDLLLVLVEIVDVLNGDAKAVEDRLHSLRVDVALKLNLVRVSVLLRNKIVLTFSILILKKQKQMLMSFWLDSTLAMGAMSDRKPMP